MAQTCKITTYFGLPGVGKTTVAASIVAKCLHQGKPVYSNVPIVGAIKLEKDDIGRYMIGPGTLILDEAGIDFNNRNFKSFTDEMLRFFKLHRHYKVDIHVFSQTYNDMDKKIRTLSGRLYIVQKSLIPYHIRLTRINKYIKVNELTDEITDGYRITPFPLTLFDKRIFAPFYWKYFDTYDAPKLEEKEFPTYGKVDIKQSNKCAFSRAYDYIIAFIKTRRSKGNSK